MKFSLRVERRRLPSERIFRQRSRRFLSSADQRFQFRLRHQVYTTSLHRYKQTEH